MWVFFLLKWVRFFRTKHAGFFESGRKNAKKVEKMDRFLKILSMFLKEMVGFWGVFFRGVACLVSSAFGVNIANHKYLLLATEDTVLGTPYGENAEIL